MSVRPVRPRWAITACLAIVAALGAVGVPARESAASPPPPPGGGSSFTLPSTTDTDKTLTFTVTGAVVTPVPGAPEGNYEGYVTGDTVSIQASGTFVMGDGLVTYLSMGVSLSAEGASASATWPAAGGSETVHGPLNWAQTLSVEIPVTKGSSRYVSFSVHVTNCGDWVCGSVSGTGSLTGWIPLCDEAEQFFLDQAAQFDKRGIRVGIDQLSPEIQAAIDRWETAHNSKATMSPGGDAIAAGMWLFSDGGVNLRRWISSFSLSPDPNTPDGEKLLADILVAQKQGKLWDGTYVAPAGTESALLQQIALTSTRENRKLGFGDVYGLALDQTGGDTMLAALLAHNALRSVARNGTFDITGVEQDLSFFTKYLDTLRDGDNSGVWYHTFGTMYYQLEVAQGTSVGSKVHSALGVAGAGLLYVPSWLFSNATEYFLGWQKPFRFQQMLEGIINGALPTTDTGWSGFANSAEQAYREIFGGRDPDPEKYCFNVWGTRLAREVTNRLFPNPPFQIFDSTRTNPYSNMAGDTMPIQPPTSGPRSPDGSPFDPTQPLPRLGGTGSPVDVLLELDGVKLFLDQESGIMAATGDFPYPVWPSVSEDGTYGLWWVVPPGMSDPTISYQAVDDGTLHQFSADAASGRIEVWSVDVESGDTASWTPSPVVSDDATSVTTHDPSANRTEGTMVDDRGDEVSPRVVTVEFSEDGHVLVPADGPNLLLLGLGVVALALAGLGVVIVRRRRVPALAAPVTSAPPPPPACTGTTPPPPAAAPPPPPLAPPAPPAPTGWTRS